MFNTDSTKSINDQACRNQGLQTGVIVERRPRYVSVRPVEQNFALFLKVLVDLVLDETGSISCRFVVG